MHALSNEAESKDKHVVVANGILCTLAVLKQWGAWEKIIVMKCIEVIMTARPL